MTRRDVLVVVALLAVALLAVAPRTFAQDPSGTWAGETSGAGGLAARPITLLLNADGTGALEVDVVLQLEDVTVDGNKVAFAVRPIIAGGPAGFRLRYEGEVEGDTMTLHVMLVDGGGGGRGENSPPLVLTRVSPAEASPR
jgi:hypothetical protein